MVGPPSMRGDMMPNNLMPPLGNQNQGYDGMPNNTYMGGTSGGQMINRGRMGEGGFQDGNYPHSNMQGYNGPGGAQGNYAYQRQGYGGQGGQYGNTYRPMQGYPNQGGPGNQNSGQFPYGQQGDRWVSTHHLSHWGLVKPYDVRHLAISSAGNPMTKIGLDWIAFV